MFTNGRRRFVCSRDHGARVTGQGWVDAYYPGFGMLERIGHLDLGGIRHTKYSFHGDMKVDFSRTLRL